MNHRQAEYSGSLGPRGGFVFDGGPTALSGGASPNQFPTRAERGLEWYDPNTNKMLIGGVGSVPRDLGVKVSHKLFSPRAGLAYRIGPRLVLRAGFGISTDPYPLARPLRTNHPVVIDFNAVGANSFQFAGRLEDGIPPIAAPALWQRHHRHPWGSGGDHARR
jgi:hypothetical protein